MNKPLAGLAGGLAGAVAVTLLAELLRKNFSNAPRLDKLGEEALDKTVSKLNGEHVPVEKQYRASLAADLISNTLYYSATAFKPRAAVLTGTILGATAGAGAVKLPARLGLNEENTAGTKNKKLLTIALYTVGGLIAGLVTRRLTP